MTIFAKKIALKNLKNFQKNHTFNYPRKYSLYWPKNFVKYKNNILTHFQTTSCHTVDPCFFTTSAKTQIMANSYKVCLFAVQLELVILYIICVKERTELSKQISLRMCRLYKTNQTLTANTLLSIPWIAS